MQPETPSPGGPQEVPEGLPPVTPPSGKFIAQLFFVPGIIVIGVVGCVMFFTWLVSGTVSREHLLKDLRNPNPEVRWRTAEQLARVFSSERDDALAADATFALDLAEMLSQALHDNEQAEKAWADQMLNQPGPASAAQDKSGKVEPPKHLKDDRTFIAFLIPCQGGFLIPTGVPLLNEIAVKEEGADPPTIALRRRNAVTALANVGENLKRFDKLGAGRQEAILATLQTEAASGTPERREWAKAARAFLEARRAGTPQAFQVDRTFEKCAGSDDPWLRKLTAQALTFWEGNAEETARMEETLLKLSRDDGHGAETLAKLSTAGGLDIRDNESTIGGREIRYQAARALASRGSAKVAERLPLFEEMLDEEFLAKTFRVKLKDGREQADTWMAEIILKGALKGLTDLHQKNPQANISSLHPAIEKLTQSDNIAVATEAKRTLLILRP